MIALIILLYLLIAFATYQFVFLKKENPKWEKVALSLSWICVLPLYAIRKIQELCR